MTAPAREAVSDYCLAALLRCHRYPHGVGWSSAAPRVGVEDQEELLLRWALSEKVRRVALRVVERPRDIRSAIAFETQTYSGSIPGAVNARETALAQELTGDCTLFVVSEPAISPLTRRNHVLAWVLREAASLILAAIKLHDIKPDKNWIHERAALLDSASRSRLLREVMMSPMGRRRPGGSEMRDANKSMSPLYRDAADAFLMFEAVERLEPDALRELMSTTLLADLEDWQRLELAAGLAAAEALSGACRMPVRWKGSIAGGSDIASVGPYSVRWQHTLDMRPTGQLDASEIMARDAAEALGPGLGGARSDISVSHARVDANVAHLECKWFGSPSSERGAIAEAVAQLVRYCRDSRPASIPAAASLLRDCVVVCSMLEKYSPSLDGAKPVGLTDFAGLISGGLAAWAERLETQAALGIAA